VLWIGLVLVVSIVVSLARGGKLSNLGAIEVTAWWLLFVGFGMQTVANSLPSSSREAAIPLLLSSFVVLLLVVWLNRADPGLWIAGIGILMNFTVIAINQGMPVLQEAIEVAGGSAAIAFDAKHVVLDASTRLPFLGDVIPLPGSVISLGDVFLAIGLGVFLEDQLRQPLRLFRHRVQGLPGSAADR
jgi:hypothetical protein